MLLNLCANLLSVQAGRIDNTFDRPAMLFQQLHLLPWKSVLDNIALGLKARGVLRAERLAAACRMGHVLELDDIAIEQFPGQLFGGMQSRAALARALAGRPGGFTAADNPGKRGIVRAWITSLSLSTAGSTGYTREVARFTAKRTSIMRSSSSTARLKKFIAAGIQKTRPRKRRSDGRK